MFHVPYIKMNKDEQKMCFQDELFSSIGDAA